jgi:Flp pilus assembly protein TadD
MLYREAPVFVSIGDRSKARRHLLRAVKLAPDYPANRLNLVESYVLWGEKSEARIQFKKLEALLPAARINLTGAIWAAEWADWEQRIAKARRALQD